MPWIDHTSVTRILVQRLAQADDIFIGEETRNGHRKLSEVGVNYGLDR